MRKTSLLILLSLSFVFVYSCKEDEPKPSLNMVDCYTCTSLAETVEDVCENDFIDEQYYQNAGYNCVKTYEKEAN